MPAWTTPGTAVAGDVLTAARWNTDVRDNTTAAKEAAFYLATVTRTTNYSITATTVAAAADVFSSDLSFTAVSGKLYRFEIYSPSFLVASANQNYSVLLVDGSGTNLMQIGFNRNANGAMWHPFYAGFLYAAGSGSVSFNIRCTKDGGSDGSFDGGTGTGGANAPARMTVYGPVD